MQAAVPWGAKQISTDQQHQSRSEGVTRNAGSPSKEPCRAAGDLRCNQEAADSAPHVHAHAAHPGEGPAGPPDHPKVPL